MNICRPVSVMLWVLFVLYILAVLGVTLIYGQSINELHLIPFEVISAQWRQLLSGSALPFVFNVIGNILMFMPIGFFLPLLKNLSFPKTVLCGFVFSIVIELIQLPLDRVSDVDDLILNTVGAMLGFGVYILFKRLSVHIKKCTDIPKKHL